MKRYVASTCALKGCLHWAGQPGEEHNDIAASCGRVAEPGHPGQALGAADAGHPSALRNERPNHTFRSPFAQPAQVRARGEEHSRQGGQGNGHASAPVLANLSPPLISHSLSLLCILVFSVIPVFSLHTRIVYRFYPVRRKNIFRFIRTS